jgi:phosphonate transport system substrate-binding protein
VPGSQAIAQGYEDQFFETYFIAHKSSALEASEELPKALANLTFTFGSKGSTSGRLMPEYYIRQTFQQAPEEVFSRIGFSGNHNRTIALVQSGAYQVGAVNYKVWESELAAGTINTGDVQVIWKTPAYQDYQWSIRGDVDQRWGEGFSAKITQTLLDISDEDLLASFPRKSFIKATNSDYQAIEDIAIAIDLMTE